MEAGGGALVDFGLIDGRRILRTGCWWLTLPLGPGLPYADSRLWFVLKLVGWGLVAADFVETPA